MTCTRVCFANRLVEEKTEQDGNFYYLPLGGTVSPSSSLSLRWQTERDGARVVHVLARVCGGELCWGMMDSSAAVKFISKRPLFFHLRYSSGTVSAYSFTISPQPKHTTRGQKDAA